MTGNSAVLDLGRSFPDGDGIDDFAAGLSAGIRVLRATYAALGPQMSHQIFFQHSAGLNE